MEVNHELFPVVHTQEDGFAVDDEDEDLMCASEMLPPGGGGGGGRMKSKKSYSPPRALDIDVAKVAMGNRVTSVSYTNSWCAG